MRDVRFLEGWPAPGNMVLGGLGQDTVSLIEDWIATYGVSGRMARKHRLGWPGPGCGQFDKGLSLGQDMGSLIKD